MLLSLCLNIRLVHARLCFMMSASILTTSKPSRICNNKNFNYMTVVSVASIWIYVGDLKLKCACLKQDPKGQMHRIQHLCVLSSIYGRQFVYSHAHRKLMESPCSLIMVIEQERVFLISIHWAFLHPKILLEFLPSNNHRLWQPSDFCCCSIDVSRHFTFLFSSSCGRLNTDESI